jgi:uncharacterized protein YuzE
MKITYDPKADALYIALRDVPAVDGVDIEEGVSVDLDDQGHMIGIEILDASERLTADELTSVSYENLLLASAETPAAKASATSRRAATA